MAHTRKNISKGISPDTKPKGKPDLGKGKSGGDPHGRTIKEKVTDVITGTGLSTKGRKIRDAIVIGPSTLIPGLKSKEFYKSVGKKVKNLAARADNIVKKAHAHKKE